MKTEFLSRMEATRDNVLVLFDIDGTLTLARKSISPELKKMLVELRKKVSVGVVGGSDFNKQREQLGEDVLDLVDYSFSENGLIAYHEGKLIHSKSMKDHIGEEKLKSLINFCLRYIADLDIPIKRGTFVEFRTGMLNVSPIGRNCNQKEREDFEAYDKIHKIREKLIEDLKKNFSGYDLCYAIGGQISIDVFPKAWDKTYCLQHVKSRGFKEIHFFGDKTEIGGNDYEIFESPETIGHTVKNPEETQKLLSQMWLSTH